MSAMSGTPAVRASDRARELGAAPAEAAAAPGAAGLESGGERLGHATWHSQASPGPPGQPSQGRNARTYDLELEQPPRRSVGERKTSFNMRGLLRSVSMHGFGKRGPAGASALESRDMSELSAKGWLLEKEGKLGEAELMYSRHCVRSQKNHGKDSMPLARDLDRLVALLRKEGKLEDAEPLCRRSLDIKRKSLGEGNLEVASAFIDLGRVLHDKGSYAKALAMLRDGLSIRESLLGRDHPDTITALAWVGDVHGRRDEYEEALAIARRVAEAHEATLGSSDIKVASSINNVGGLLATLGRPDEALPMFTRAHEIYAQNLGDQHPRAVAAQLWMQQLSAPQPQPRPRRRSPPPRASARGRRSNHPAVIEEGLEESTSGKLLTSAPEDSVVPPTPPAVSADEVQAEGEGVASHLQAEGDGDA